MRRNLANLPVYTADVMERERHTSVSFLPQTHDPRVIRRKQSEGCPVKYLADAPQNVKVITETESYHRPEETKD